MDVVELHTWNSTVERLEEPDRLVLNSGPRAGRAVPGGGDRGAAGARRWKDCLVFARGLAATLARHVAGAGAARRE